MAYRLVLARWHDAWFDADVPGDGYRSDYLVQTVGWLVSQDETRTSIAAELLPDDEGVRAISHIPESSIVDVTDLVPRQQ